jgi:predicted RNA-binding Zn ribbon-like protein
LSGNGTICKWGLIVPEHRPDTPSKYRCLESFLWHDFEAGRSDWEVWLRRKLPDVSPVRAASVFRRAMKLHATLRSLQAANSGIKIGKELSVGRAMLNQLISVYGIKPRLSEDGQISLATDKPADPIAGLMLMALDALQSGFWRRFKLCNEPTCRASYYDASKAAAKTWCSMQTCGSRNKMKRYRAKA